MAIHKGIIRVKGTKKGCQGIYWLVAVGRSLSGKELSSVDGRQDSHWKLGELGVGKSILWRDTMVTRGKVLT